MLLCTLRLYEAVFNDAQNASFHAHHPQPLLQTFVCLKIKYVLLWTMCLHKPLFIFAQNPCVSAHHPEPLFTHPCSFVRNIHASVSHEPLQDRAQLCAKYVLFCGPSTITFTNPYSLVCVNYILLCTMGPHKSLFIYAQTTCFSAYHPQPLLQTLVQTLVRKIHTSVQHEPSQTLLIFSARIRVFLHIIQRLFYKPLFTCAQKDMLLCSMGLHKPF